MAAGRARAIVMVMAAGLAASSLACAPIPAGKMDTPTRAEILVAYDRTGGFGGFDDHVVLHEDGRASVQRRGGDGEVALDAKRLEKLKSALAEVDFPALRDEYRANGADLFTYRIAARGRTITFMDSAVPPPLEPVLRLLNQIVDNSAVPPR